MVARIASKDDLHFLAKMQSQNHNTTFFPDTLTTASFQMKILRVVVSYKVKFDLLKMIRTLR